jgi:hypothetical protein
VHVVAPGFVAKEPRGHLVQLVDADVLEKEPGAHAVHCGAVFCAANVPGTHAVHVVEPAGAAVPAKHVMQPEVICRVPAGQIWQVTVLLVGNVPGGHGVHMIDPVVFATWSTAQRRQRAEPGVALQMGNGARPPVEQTQAR